MKIANYYHEVQSCSKAFLSEQSKEAWTFNRLTKHMSNIPKNAIGNFDLLFGD